MSLYNSSNSYPQVITFNSKDRISGSNESFTSFPVNLNSNNYNTICVSNVSIPKSWFNVPAGNSFTLKEDTNTTIISITAGSYNKNTIATAVQNALNTNSVLGFIYSVSYAQPNKVDTFRFVFSVSGNGSIQPEFIFGTSLFQQLGFEQNTTYQFALNTLTSPNCMNLQYILRLFLVSNIAIGSTDNVIQEILDRWEDNKTD